MANRLWKPAGFRRMSLLTSSGLLSCTSSPNTNRHNSFCLSDPGGQQGALALHSPGVALPGPGHSLCRCLCVVSSPVAGLPLLIQWAVLCQSPVVCPDVEGPCLKGRGLVTVHSLRHHVQFYAAKSQSGSGLTALIHFKDQQTAFVWLLGPVSPQPAWTQPGEFKAWHLTIPFSQKKQHLHGLQKLFPFLMLIAYASFALAH